jgi:hypothetical protein
VTLALIVTACGTTIQSSPSEHAPSPSNAISTPASTRDGTAVTDLSAIGCARNDPADEGQLTGVWAGNDSGTYYIRQVGDCVWWFGTEVREIDLGATDQRGFANVASGRIVGTQIDLEWADVPLGDTINGGGLTFIYEEASDQLRLVEQRGGIPFGGTLLTRIDPDASQDVSPSPSTDP